MRIRDLLSIDAIELNANPATKLDTIDQAIALMQKNGNIVDVENYKSAVLEREEQDSTGVGGAIAIPHGRGEGVSKAGLAAMVVPNGVDYDSVDGAPVKLVFLIAAPETKDNVHLQVLSKLSVLLMDETLSESLIAAKTPQEFMKIIDDAEDAREAVEAKRAADQASQAQKASEQPIKTEDNAQQKEKVPTVLLVIGGLIALAAVISMIL